MARNLERPDPLEQISRRTADSSDPANEVRAAAKDHDGVAVPRGGRLQSAIYLPSSRAAWCESCRARAERGSATVARSARFGLASLPSLETPGEDCSGQARDHAVNATRLDCPQCPAYALQIRLLRDSLMPQELRPSTVRGVGVLDRAVAISVPYLPRGSENVDRRDGKGSCGRRCRQRASQLSYLLWALRVGIPGTAE